MLGYTSRVVRYHKKDQGLDYHKLIQSINPQKEKMMTNTATDHHEPKFDILEPFFRKVYQCLNTINVLESSNKNGSYLTPSIRAASLLVMVAWKPPS